MKPISWDSLNTSRKYIVIVGKRSRIDVIVGYILRTGSEGENKNRDRSISSLSDFTAKEQAAEMHPTMREFLRILK